MQRRYNKRTCPHQNRLLSQTYSSQPQDMLPLHRLHHSGISHRDFLHHRDDNPDIYDLLKEYNVARYYDEFIEKTALSEELKKQALNAKRGFARLLYK